MTRITNTSAIRQPVHTVSGVIWVPAGKTRELDLSGPGKKLVEASADLVVEAPRRRKSKKQGAA